MRTERLRNDERKLVLDLSISQSRNIAFSSLDFPLDFFPWLEILIRVFRRRSSFSFCFTLPTLFCLFKRIADFTSLSRSSEKYLFRKQTKNHLVVFRFLRAFLFIRPLFRSSEFFLSFMPSNTLCLRSSFPSPSLWVH